ncbi:hypothetical protein OHAE_4429 [Ochrobactrum soli]|uniref:Uncharacterized protein n=1 Tax=Ochrobactrum soli TaxID=2448455 RepID=A0A2P9HC41_9HYPH|nr:hypothetical protein OHAE_4429 [[Ochrobactrum] soli]
MEWNMTSFKGGIGRNEAATRFATRCGPESPERSYVAET